MPERQKRKQNKKGQISSDSEIFERSFKRALDDLVASNFLGKLQDTLKNTSSIFSEIICYGIGNFSTSVNARYQLVLLTLIQSDRKCCYDPVLTDFEKEFLKSKNISVIETNEEAKRPVFEPTLFYLPHCPHALGNNILWANWSPEKLANVVILGNSFDNILTHSTRVTLQSECSFMLKSQPFLSEVEVENCFKFTDIFNNMGLHHFSASALDTVEKSTWECAEEPVYDKETTEAIFKLENLTL